METYDSVYFNGKKAREVTAALRDRKILRLQPVITSYGSGSNFLKVSDVY